MSHLLTELISLSSHDEIAYAYEFMLTLMLKFGCPVEFYQILVSNIRQIFSIPEIWGDLIFRKIYLQNFESLIKGLVRVLSLCSCEDASILSANSKLRKTLKE